MEKALVSGCNPKNEPGGRIDQESALLEGMLVPDEGVSLGCKLFTSMLRYRLENCWHEQRNAGILESNNRTFSVPYLCQDNFAFVMA
jgi:hypothetical protein